MKKLPAQPISDSTLAACCRADPDAWRRFVRHASPVIHAVVARIIRQGGASQIEVADAVQEVFLRLCARNFRLLKTFEPSRSALPTFLRVVASSTTIDLLRKNRPMGSAMPDELPAPKSVPDFAGDDLAMDVLTDRQRLILRLLFQSQMEVRDVARALGINEQTVRSSKHKALERLRAAQPPESAAARPRKFAGDILAPDPV